MLKSTDLAQNLADIQGDILRGYHLGFARYLGYRVDSATRGRQWMRELAAQVTSAAPWKSGEKPDSTLNVAVSYRGLEALGLAASSLESFPEEGIMDNHRLDPIEEFDPDDRSFPVEIGGPETRLTGPRGSPQMGLQLRSPRHLPVSWDSWPPTLWRDVCNPTAPIAGTFGPWTTHSPPTDRSWSLGTWTRRPVFVTLRLSPPISAGCGTVR